MRIGIFDPYLDTLGGGEKYILTAASCLSKVHEVNVFWDDPSILEKANERFPLDLSNVGVAKNIFAPRVSLWKRLRQTLTYDCIIYLSDGSIPLTFAKKLIVHFQFPVQWVDREEITTRMKLVQVTKMICNSKFTKYYIDKVFHVDSEVIYPPCITAALRPSKRKQNIILTVGRFGRLPEGRNFKKQDVLIEAFKSLLDGRTRDWQLFVVMSYKEEDAKEVRALETLAKNYPIHIVKNANHEVVRRLYERAKIYWHAAGYGEDLEKHPERAEHFGIATVEAMGAGAVPMVFSGGGQREIVEDEKNGLLWNTTEELIEKTRMLVAERWLWTRLSNEARSRSIVFGEERFCQEVARIVQ